jgi:hypothetical protein
MLPDDILCIVMEFLPFVEVNSFLEIIQPSNLINVDKILANVYKRKVCITKVDGDTLYKVEGKLWRLDGPAYISNYALCWYQNDKLHRLDGPAKVTNYGREYWYQNNKLHRENGPAELHPVRGKYKWYKNGVVHRENGPALIKAHGSNNWVSAEMSTDGIRKWYINGELHNDKGPAVILRNSIKKWFNKGKLHREDGPAITYLNGVEIWYRNGVRHRDAGPAYEGPNGYQAYYMDGILMYEEANNLAYNDISDYLDNPFY